MAVRMVGEGGIVAGERLKARDRPWNIFDFGRAGDNF